MMQVEEFEALGEKVANGTATPGERLAFLKELNGLLAGMRADIAELKGNQEPAR